MKKGVGLCLVILCMATSFAAKAAKEVPTFRIEIPKDPSIEVPAEPSLIPGDAIESEPLFNEDLIEPETREPSDEPDVQEGDDGTEPSKNTEDTEPANPVNVFYGDEKLPDAVKTLRAKLIDVARSGDIERLRPIFEGFNHPPQVSFDGDGDAVNFLKESSGDGEGVEVLAILIEVLESGYVHREEGEEGEIFIWPYFVDTPLDSLTPIQLVELFRIVTAGDYIDMQDYGAYIFYRVGITPDGELKFFVAGD